MKRFSDYCLLALFILSLVTLLVAHEDPFIRDAICGSWCPTVANAKAWNKIAYDLAIGAATTLFFYFLVVWLPERKRRRRLKEELQKHYRSFKTACISCFLGALGGSYPAELPEDLLPQEQFRAYFKERNSDSTDRWDDVFNGFEEWHLHRLLTHLEIFRDEIRFVLSNSVVPLEEPSEFLKRLSIAISEMKHVEPGYDDEKRIARFLWEIFAGWDRVSGYRKSDIIQETIDAL
jgi:hypothetical protein